MKSILILACAFAACSVVLTNDMKISDSEMEECLEDSGLTQEEMEQINQTNMKEIEGEELEKLVGQWGCFMACISEKRNALVNGKFDANITSTELAKHYNVSDDPESISIIYECVDKANEESDECTAALQLYVCVVDVFEDQ